MYFVLTTPTGIPSVERVHRRWLAAVALALLVATLLRAAIRVMRR